MLTSDEVLIELKERGYDIKSRRLVDWRQKELLPPLVKRGQGQGRGWGYGWEDALIVEQVITVQELLWMHERTGWLYAPLWCLGFEVPLDRVRSQLLVMLERGQARLTGGKADPTAVADHVSALVLQEATRPGPRTERRWSADVHEYWLNLWAGDTDYALDWEGLDRVAAGVSSSSGPGASQGKIEGGLHTWSPAELRLIRRWSRRYASLPRLEEAARNATEAEWAAVHADWRSLGQLIRAVSALAEREIPEAYRELGLRAVAVAGPWLSLVDLSMRSRGRGRVWDTLRHEFVSMRERLEQDPSMQEQMRQLWVEARVSQDDEDVVSSE